MKRFQKIFITVAVIVLGTAFWVWRDAVDFLDTPPQSESREIYFDVPQGAHLNAIAQALAEKGLVTDARKFSWLARFENAANRLQAGRFLLNANWTPDQILDALVNGKAALERITIPEGLTWWQTGKLLEDAGFVRFEDFKAVIHDKDFLNHHGIPFSSAEGFLMPDTYLLKKPDSPMPGATDELPAENAEKWRQQAKVITSRLIDNFWRKSSSLWPASANGEGKPKPNELRRLVILASIVEKETGLPEERGKVAGVYANRLKRNMLLQADPTVIYGLGPDFVGKLRRSQLDDPKNPYNTYQLPGLPPGPICSFGSAALAAAIKPEEHDFLYFVASRDGGDHVFSRTLNEHNEAARQYRLQKSK